VRTIYWIVVAMVPVVFLALMYLVDREPAIDPHLLRTAVVGISSESNQVPEYSPSDTLALDLPNFDERPSIGKASSAWYRHTFDAPAMTDGIWGLLIPYERGNFAIHINDQLVGESAPMVRPYAEFRVPLYFEFPASMLHAGTNTVDIHAVSERLGSWLAPFYLGPSRELKPAFDYLHFVQVTLLSSTIVALGVVSVLLLGLFWIRTCDTAHGWFAAATICWALYNWLTLEPRVLLPNAGIWFTLPIISLGWFTIFSAHFVNRLPGCKRPPRIVERGFLAFGVANSLLVMWHSQVVHGISWVQNLVWQPGLLLISAFIVWQLLRATLRHPNFEVRLWLSASALALVVGLRDYLWDQNLFMYGTFHYLSYTVSFVLIALAITLLTRVSRALTEAETLNRELENRVAAKGVELARNYERLQSLERERTISAERERMTADMHDGIGGQLVHALAVTESNPDFEPLEPILRGALDDLRLIIDSADPMEGDLLVVLSNFRARNERRVQAGGLTFLWQVTELPTLPDFGPHKILQVLRILQEALTNVIKHAQATQVTVRTSTATDAGGVIVIVDVIDDGTGFVAGNVSANLTGRGLNNMRRRAHEFGGSVELAAMEKGSRLRLILPVIDRRHIAR
jgi:signal transduction histidine kinase